MKHATLGSPHRRTSDAPRVIAAVPAARESPELIEDIGEQYRWKDRPHLARIVRLLILAIPLAACIGSAIVLSTVLPRASHLGTELLWWLAVIGGSTVVLVLMNRVARQLMPLALLLRLSMLFPDHAPTRYRVAAKAWSSRRLQQQVEHGGSEVGRDNSGASVDAATKILALITNLAAHDPRTRGHCERVRAYNDLLAEELGLSRADRDRLRWAALIHDIGKLKVSHQLLNKPARPTASEWAILRAHPTRGAEIAAPLAGWLGQWAPAIEQHHERWDGTGYPDGLAGEEISLGARIVSVADAYEVMTSLRPYGRPVNAEQARAELAECAGTHFDPVVVRAFLNISIGKLRAAMGWLVLLAQVPLMTQFPRVTEAARRAGPAVAGAGVAAIVAMSVLVASPDRTASAATTAVGPSTHAAPQTVTPPTAGRQPVKATANSKPVARHAAPPSVDARGRTVGRHQPTGTVTSPVPKARRTTPPSTPASTPPTTKPPAGGVRKHGRCAGNNGNGAGNGGAKGGPGHKSRGHTKHRPPGLNACA